MIGSEARSVYHRDTDTPFTSAEMFDALGVAVVLQVIIVTVEMAALLYDAPFLHPGSSWGSVLHDLSDLLREEGAIFHT